MKFLNFVLIMRKAYSNVFIEIGSKFVLQIYTSKKVAEFELKK